jgi:hypothetical protein
MHLGSLKIQHIILTPQFPDLLSLLPSRLGSTLSPLTFVQFLSQCLANQHPAYRKALEQQGSTQYVIKSEVKVEGDVAPEAEVVGTKIGTVRIEIRGGDARPLFDQMVRRPLQALSGNPELSIVVLIDFLTRPSPSPRGQHPQLLADERLPPQVRFFLPAAQKSTRVRLVCEPHWI